MKPYYRTLYRRLYLIRTHIPHNCFVQWLFIAANDENRNQEKKIRKKNHLFDWHALNKWFFYIGKMEKRNRCMVEYERTHTRRTINWTTMKVALEHYTPESIVFRNTIMAIEMESFRRMCGYSRRERGSGLHKKTFIELKKKKLSVFWYWSYSHIAVSFFSTRSQAIRNGDKNENGNALASISRKKYEKLKATKKLWQIQAHVFGTQHK